MSRGNAARRISQHRVKGQRLQEFIDADKLNDEGRLEKKYQNSTSTRAAKRAKTQPESDGGSEEISNAELAANLASKIVANASRFGKCKRLLYLSLKTLVTPFTVSTSQFLLVPMVLTITKTQVIAVMADNASNLDTLVEELE
ncbi:hypothetical protein JOM56_014805 [Amanita muscaria]